MFMNLRWAATSVGVLNSLLLLQCGGRSGMLVGDGGPPPVACVQDSDCFDGDLCTTKACVNDYCSTIAQKTCDDGNECTSDTCDSWSGACVFTPRMKDNDGDGFYGPLPGTVAGAPGSCGNDCNDTSAAVYPGAPELCDGYDNNCNGIVDDGAFGYSSFGSPVRVTDDSFIDGGPTGLVYNGSYFGLAFTGSTSSNNTYQGYFKGYDVWETPVVSTTNLTQTSQDSFAGPLVWTGAVFGTAWEVHGDKSYDIRFNQVDVRGQKMGPDLVVSSNPGFSIQPSLLWNGVEYWLAWSDDNGGDLFQVYGRRISADAQFSGARVTLTDLTSDARSPLLLRSPTSYLLFFYSAQSHAVCARLLGDDMTPMNTSFCLSGTGANDFTAEWVGDRFVVAWSTKVAQPGPTIWATAIDSQGNVIQPAQAITSGATFARSPSVLSLGDRFAMAWADDRVTYGHYGIRFSTFSATLSRLSDVQAVVESDDDCIYPGLASGGVGLALVYRQRNEGQTGFPYFMAMTCN